MLKVDGGLTEQRTEDSSDASLLLLRRRDAWLMRLMGATYTIQQHVVGRQTLDLSTAITVNIVGRASERASERTSERASERLASAKRIWRFFFCSKIARPQREQREGAAERE